MDSSLRDRERGLNIHAPERVAIIGAGGVGAWVGILLAQAGTKELHVFDDDILEEHNLNRLPYPLSWVGKLKVTALKKFIMERYKTQVFSFSTKFDYDLLLSPITYLVDCSDDYKTQLSSFKLAEDKGIYYKRVGTNSHHITVVNAVTEWTDGSEEEGQCGVTIPQYIAPQVVAAGYAVAQILTGLPKNISKDIV